MLFWFFVHSNSAKKVLFTVHKDLGLIRNKTKYLRLFSKNRNIYTCSRAVGRGNITSLLKTLISMLRPEFKHTIMRIQGSICANGVA